MRVKQEVFMTSKDHHGVEVSWAEFIKAMARWMDVFDPNLRYSDMSSRFEDFLMPEGDRIYVQANWGRLMPSRAAERIKAINGPHGITLLKAWKIKNAKSS